MQPRVKFQIMSDLHFEHSIRETFKFGDHYEEWPPGGWPVLADYLIIAGDTGLLHRHYDKLRDFFRRRCKEYKLVFFVAGNKDFPESSEKTYREGIFRAECLETDWGMNGKLKFLNKKRFDLRENGVTISILGCTLWTLIREEQFRYVRSMNMEEIRGETPSSRNNRFRMELNWIKSEVKKIRETEEDGVERKIMVITHHPPMIRGASVDNHDIRNRYSRNYCMYGNDILGGWGLPGLGAGDMWVYGHTHYTNDIYVDEVRVFSNQRGTGCPGIIENPTKNEFGLHRTVDF
jgi:hypothetical protein